MDWHVAFDAGHITLNNDIYSFHCLPNAIRSPLRAASYRTFSPHHPIYLFHLSLTLYYVFAPIADQRPFKRTRRDAENFAPPEDVVSFWRDLWVERKSPSHEETVLSYDDNVEGANVPGTMTVIRGLPRFFYNGAVMKMLLL